MTENTDFKGMTKAQLVEYLETEPKNVFQALSAVMARVGYVQKQDASGLPYSFAGERAFIIAVRPHFVDLGLSIRQVMVEHVETIEYETKKGAQAFNRVFIFTWEIAHAPSGTTCQVTSVGEGTDFGDKSCNKAQTVGLKYALRQALYIETGDDPDETSSDEFRVAQQRKADEMGLGGDVSGGDYVAPSDNGGGRVENQWEKPVLEKAVEFELVQAKPHAVNILNGSSLFQIPFGELRTEVGLGYIIAWKLTKEASPEDDNETRRELVERGWADEGKRETLISQALNLTGGK